MNINPDAGSIDSNAPNLSCATSCTISVAPGSTVALTATPAPGSQFDGWAGDCLGPQAACMLHMDGTRLAAASFRPAGHRLTVIHRFLPGGLDGWNPGGSDLLATGGYLYGMTAAGGRAQIGALFRELPDGSQHTILHDFLGGPFDGNTPYGSLVEVNGVLYGTTAAGGTGGCPGSTAGVQDVVGCGTIFKVNADGSGFTLLHSFSGASDGALSSGSLTVSDGVLYGMTTAGGTNGLGTIFKISPDGSGFAVVYSFAGDSGMPTPSGSLVASGGTLYGMTGQGGPNGDGTIFRVRSDGSGFAVVHAFGSSDEDGKWPRGSLIVSGGALYGMTLWGGGPFANGTVFKVGLDGSSFALLHSFAGGASDGAGPYGSLVDLGGMLYGMTIGGGTGGLGTIFKINPNGGGFAILHSFAGAPSDGKSPTASLIVSGNVLYGMTPNGGANGVGAIFRINPDGSAYALSHSFAGGVIDSWEPQGALTAYNGALYGATSWGGPSVAGTIFRVNPDGSGYAILHNFTFTVGASDGLFPTGSVIAAGGVLYGATEGGGASSFGTIYRLNSDGSGFATVHSFGADQPDGSGPVGSLIESAGVLYGMTHQGGTDGLGTIFKVNPDGSGYALLHSFTISPLEGSYPEGSLVASGDTLYGMTSWGIFSLKTDGSGFAVLHQFTGGALDGSEPWDCSLMVSGSVLYGMTGGGGAGNLGTMFKVNLDGTGFVVLHSFSGGASDGATPRGSLVESGGVLYGTTGGGGSSNIGTVFRINPDGTGFAVVNAFRGTNGAQPSFGGSLTELDGKFYGTTDAGGLAEGGVVFQLDLETRQPRRLLRRL